MNNKKFDQAVNAGEYIGSNKFKKFWHFFKIPLIAICSLGVITGIAYPLVVTGIGQAAFSYQANGSIIKVKLKNGSIVTYGSKLIGQDFYTNNNGQYMFGRLDFGNDSTTTTSPDAKAHFEKLFSDNNLSLTSDVPQELITKSGSGVDPNISIDAAKWQVDLIVAARTKMHETDSSVIVPTKGEILSYIQKYSVSQFVGVIGQNVTNVLMVNLAIDKKI